MTGDRVEIKVVGGQTLHNGKPYTSVGFDAKLYGQGSPCMNQEEIESAIKSCKKSIREKGDIPVLINFKQQTLSCF